MKKIIGLIVLITLAGTGLVFAHEGADKRPWPPQDAGKYYKKQPNFEKNFNCKRPQMGENHRYSLIESSLLEIKEITGEIIVKDNEFPAIKSGENEIKIMLHPDAIKSLNLNSGSKISIKGIELPALNRDVTGGKIIKVFELQYNERKFLVLGKKSGKYGFKKIG